MMNVFSAHLEARDPALGRFRSYRLEAGPNEAHPRKLVY